MMSNGPFEQVSFFLVAAILYIIPIVLTIYWMVKMLKNSNETVRLNREILEHLKRKND